MNPPIFSLRAISRIGLVLLGLIACRSMAGEAEDLLKRGKASIEKGDFDAAIGHLSQAAIWAPKDARIRYFRGMAY